MRRAILILSLLAMLTPCCNKDTIYYTLHPELGQTMSPASLTVSAPTQPPAPSFSQESITAHPTYVEPAGLATRHPSPTTVPPTHVEPTSVPPTATPTSAPSWASYTADLRSSTQEDLEALTKYHINLTLLDFAAGLLDGQARITYTNDEGVPLPDLLLRLYPNTPGYGGDLEIKELDVNGIPVETTLELWETALRIPLPEALTPGLAAELTIDYQLQVPNANRAGYGALNNEGGVMVLGGFYPGMAVYGPDGWQADLVTGVGDSLYAEAAFFAVTVTVPSNVVIISSGRTVEMKPGLDSDATWHLVGGPVRDFALVLGQSYTTSSDVLEDVQVEFFYLSPSGQAAAQQVLGHAVDALQVYERLFGPYPFTELDLVQAPINASGLEYPGVVLLGPSAFDQGGQWLELVVAHEVAHQWWYGLVGNDQVNAAWLDEGLASYSSILYFREVYGQDRANELMSLYYQQPYQAQSASLQQIPANRSVTSYTAENYGPVVYIHSTNFFYNLHQTLGEEAFLGLLRRFLTDYRYRVAQGRDFVGLAETFDPVSVDSLFSRWILGQP